MQNLNESDIELPGYYIIIRHDEKTGKREQHAKLEATIKGEKGVTLYTGYYGIYGYHEIFVKLENIRQMTPKEKETHEAGHHWDLPQQFYHSFMTLRRER